MSVFTSTLIVRGRNRVGNLIISKWKTLNTLRSMPLQVANPDTLLQQMRRGMFAALTETGNAFLPLLQIGMRGFLSRMTALNAFVKVNYGSAVAPGVPPAFTVDYSLMQVARGSISDTQISSLASADASANVTVNWPTALASPNQASTDLARILVLQEGADNYAMNLGTIARSAGTAVITLPSALATGDDIHAYLFFQSASSGKVSSSTYLGQTVS